MKRLTQKDENGFYLTGDGIYSDWGVPEKFRGEDIDRLADIEDILGDDYELDRLRELVEADRDGRCVALPCKRYDILWTFFDSPAKTVYSFYVTDISTLNGRTMLNTDIAGVVDARDIGKTVFRTRAEAALKARED